MTHATPAPVVDREHSPSCDCRDCDLERRRAAAKAEDAAYADRVPAKAAALYRFISACEDVAEAQPLRDCRTCVGAGCQRCGGWGFALDPALVRAVQAVLVAATALDRAPDAGNLVAVVHQVSQHTCSPCEACMDEMASDAERDLVEEYDRQRDDELVAAAAGRVA